MKIPVNQIICGDALEVLKTFPDESVNSMTTCVVAQRMNRKYIGIELNPKYVKIGQERLRQKTLL
jgi:DNA modification methylase